MNRKTSLQLNKLLINNGFVNLLFMKIKQKNLYHLLMVFREVVKQGSFTAAADKLELTKSAVSQYITRLEQHLGVQLLIRSTRALSLTSIGHKLLGRSEELNTLLDITIDEINNIKQQPTGSLSITVPQALAKPIVLPALKRFNKQFPKVQPKLIVDDGNLDIVKQGIDIAVRVGDLQDSELKASKIGEHQEILVASTSYLSSLTHEVTLDNIEEHPFIATSWQTTNLSHYFKDNKGAEFEAFLKPKFEVNSANIALDLVSLGLGIALLPDVFVKQHINEGKIQAVFGQLKGKKDNIYYVHAYKDKVPLKVKWLIEFLKKSMNESASL